MKEDVCYLSKQINEQERYNSKNCIIVSNLPLTSGISNFKDVTQFLREYLGIVVQETDLQACHPLGKFTDRRQPPNVIVRFLHFYTKDRIWARKYQLKGKMNPINNKTIYLRDCLTKPDSDLLDYARGLGCVTTSMNSAPQVFVKTSFGKKAHTVTDQTDVDELFTGGKIILRRTRDLKKTSSKTPNQSKFVEAGSKRKNMESSPDIDLGDLIQKLKSAKQDPVKLQAVTKEFFTDDVDAKQQGQNVYGKL